MRDEGHEANLEREMREVTNAAASNALVYTSLAMMLQSDSHETNSPFSHSRYTCKCAVLRSENARVCVRAR